MTKKEKRTEIIEIGTELISVNGYNATGIESILKRAGVPKGSFYHYFKSKEDFGMAVIDQFAREYDVKLRSFLEDDTLPPLERLRNYFEHSLAHLTEKNFTKGCLIGNLGQELADQNERFRERLEVIFQSWKQLFSSCIHEAQVKGDLTQNIECDILADFVLASWEGAVLRSKVMKSPQSIEIFIDTIFTTALCLDG